ncbi:hypothetical protein [Azospirillum palustre]|uniref:hypothetical protein n=1 Tax=Azospirillum palustre TaxID=2044885 RepID=UPI001177618C|nr:hypothetical protein [Azospirillum palustre]
MTTWYRARFLFCSFGPLYLLLCIGLAVQHEWMKQGLKGNDVIVMLIAGIFFILSFFVFLNLRNGFSAASPSRYSVKPLESLDGSVLSYMLSYIPPLMIDDLSSVAKVAPAIVFYAVLILIMIRTDTMYVNPYFLLFKYRIFRVELPNSRSITVITQKQEIFPEETVTLHEIQPSKLYFSS